MHLLIICFLSFACFSCATKRSITKSDGTPHGLLPSISSDSDSQIKHASPPSLSLEDELLIYKAEGGSKKWGESISHWSIKREKSIIVENENGQSTIKGFPFSPPSFNSGLFAATIFPSSEISSRTFSKKSMTIPMPATEEDVVDGIIKISNLDFEKKPLRKALPWSFFLALFVVFCFVIYKRFNKKFKEDGNPFLEIKKRATKPLEKKRKASRNK